MSSTVIFHLKVDEPGVSTRSRDLKNTSDCNSGVARLYRAVTKAMPSTSGNVIIGFAPLDGLSRALALNAAIESMVRVVLLPSSTAESITWRIPIVELVIIQHVEKKETLPRGFM